jgi:acyl-CoA ligase (AMP-forming) (exosortase A-associated)
MRSQLHHLVAGPAGRRADAPAVSYRRATRSYAQLWREVRQVAAGLHRLGIRLDDRVAVYLDKRVETVAAIFGSSAAGAVFVPVNPLVRARQVGHILADSGARFLVTSPERLATLQDGLAEIKSLEQVVLVGTAGPDPGGADPGGADPGGGAVPRFAVTSYDQLTGGGETGFAEPGTIDSDLAAILYTSGSTGRPKGVVLTHRNLLAGAESVSHYLGNHPGDVILAALPLSFDAGFSQLTTGFHAGAHVVLANYLLPGDLVRLCAEHRVTGLTCVPPLWIQLADQAWPPEAASALRYFANTGGRLPRATLQRLRGLFPGARPFLMYGLTEAFRSTYLDPAEVDRRPDSIGKAIPNAEVLVVRPDGSQCPPGEPGELVHRGALVASGYWNDPERTSERFRPPPGRPDGLCSAELAVWSGDLVVRDPDGFLYFVGRTDEMIKTSGYRVSPTEIEEVAYDTGLVRDAVALGVEDPRLGQHILLVVTLAGGSDPQELRRQLQRQLPRYLLPREIMVLPELPRSPNGKFDRARLRQELGS